MGSAPNESRLGPLSRGAVPRLFSLDVARLPEILFAVGVVVAPLAIGGVHLGTRIALAAVMVAAFVLRAWTIHRADGEVRVGWIGAGFFLALGWSVLQWVPLPSGLVEHLAPAAHEARAVAAALVGELPPAWQSLTLDSARGAAAIVSLSAMGFAYLTAINLFATPSASARAAVYIEAAALATLGIGLLHAALGLDQLYGFYDASVPATDRAFPTPFVNPNHAAALFLLATFVAFGRWLEAERDAPWHLVAGVATSVAVFATFSRANTMLWLVGLLLLTVAAWRQQGRPEVATRAVRLLFGALACAVVAVVLLGPERWLTELESLSAFGMAPIGDQGGDGLMTCWQVGLTLFSDHWLLGVGNGAFEIAAPGAMPDWSTGLISYAHNGPLQLLAELGVVGGLVLLLVLAGAARLAIRARADIAAVASSIGVLLLLVQNLVDFSLWLPGVGLAAVTATGALASSGRDARRRLWRMRWPLLATAATLGLVALASAHAWLEAPRPRYEAVRASLAAPPDAATDARAVAASLVIAHPADFYAFHLGATVAQRDGDAALAEKLLDRARALAPTEPHVLARHLQLALASPSPPPSTAADLEQLASLRPGGLEQALALVLAPRASPAIVEAFLAVDPARILLASQRLPPDRAEELLTWGLGQHPDALPLIEALGGRWGPRRDRLDALNRLATLLLARVGGEDDLADRAGWARAAYLFQGHVERWRGEPLAAWHMFIEAADQQPARSVVPLLEAGAVAAAMGRYDLLDQLIERLSAQRPREAWPRARLHHLRSLLAEGRGDLRGAVHETQRALRSFPSVPEYEERLAGLFDALEDPRAAASARERAAHLRAEAAARSAQAPPPISIRAPSPRPPRVPALPDEHPPAPPPPLEAP